jgi:undecaprenyl pyrophosphate synthase
MYIAYNYGGQWDIINAIKLAISNNDSITPNTLSQYLSTENDFPDLNSKNRWL